MEEDEQTPFWIQTNNRRRLSSLFFNSFVLIIFLLLIAVLSMVFIIPSLINLSSNIFTPNLVKRSWDSINLILVLIALLFGFLSRNISNDEKLDYNNGYDRSEPELSTGAPIMYDLQDQSMNSAIGLRRQRTSISYPDLRELSPPWNHHAADPWRFSDDTHLNYYRAMESNRSSFRQRSRREYNSGIQDAENFNLYTPPSEMSTPGEGLYFPPPQPPPSANNTVKQKTKRVHRNVAIDDGERSCSSVRVKILSPETEPSELKGGRDERKIGNADKRRSRSSEPKRILAPVIDPFPDPTLPPPVSPLTERKKMDGNTTKDFFSSFYHKKKKKRQRDRSVDNLGALLHHSQPLAVKSQSPTPPPPPLVHHRKKLISITPPPPPPPPPRSSVNYAPRATITRVAPFVTDKPGATLMTASFNGIDDSSSGGESPMKHIPPPPPLPPFKMPDWKFAVEGDFVRLQSTLSSRSVSPDGDEARSPSSDVDPAATALFCPSPDVDTKADSFIARFRAGLKLERMSKLGPGPGTGPSDI